MYATGLTRNHLTDHVDVRSIVQVLCAQLLTDFDVMKAR